MNRGRNPWLLRLTLAGIVAIVIGAALAMLEVYVRRTQPHVVADAGRDTPGGTAETSVSSAESRFEQLLEAKAILIEETPRGRRLIPGSRAVVRNHATSDRDVVIEINSAGFRDDELPAFPPDDEYRVLALGDSITWGDYLPAELVWVERVEAALADRDTSTRVEVVNAGIGNIGIIEEIDLLLDRGLALHPDLVLLAFYLNDSLPPQAFVEQLAEPGWLRQRSVLIDQVYRNAKFLSWFRGAGLQSMRWIEAQDQLDWAHDRAAFDELVEAAAYEWGVAWRDESWGVIDRELEKLATLSRWRGFDVAIVFFPVKYQVYADFLEDTPQRTLAAKAAALDFHYLDLLPMLRQHRDEDLFFDHCHPREAANERIGVEIAGFLEEKVLP
jgi:lysophospholipase L1-like esterase